MALVINGEAISDLALEEEAEALKEHHESIGDPICCDREEEIQETARNNLLHRVLLRQHHDAQYGVVPSDQVSAAIENLKEEHGGEEAFYRNMGFAPSDEERIRSQISDSMAVQRVIDEAMGNEEEPSVPDLRSYFESHIEVYSTPEEIRVLQIFLEPQSPEETEVMYEKMRHVRNELLADTEAFESVAKEMVSDTQQIDLGFFARGGMMQEMEFLTFSMKIGEISPVFSSHYGFHIFKVVERKPPEPIPFESVREEVTTNYLTEQSRLRMEHLLESLRRKAEIEDSKAIEVAPS